MMKLHKGGGKPLLMVLRCCLGPCPRLARRRCRANARRKDASRTLMTFLIQLYHARR